RGPAAPGAAELAADLTAAGATVDVLACDVADPAAVSEVLATVDPPVGTLVHAAGTLADGALTGLTPADLASVLGPKTSGLAALLEGCPDARIVFFSSVAGVLGSPGQANYAAANAVLDATAEQLRAAGRRATSLAWGLWEAESDLTARLSETARRRLAATGTRAIGVAEGLGMLDAALGAPAGAAAVRALFPFTAAGQAPAEYADVPALLRALVPTTRRRAAATTGPAGGGLRERLAVTPPGRRVGTVLEVVRAQVAAVLGYAGAGAVAAERPYLELGLDSVTMLDLRNRLGAAVDTTVGVTAFYDHPTPLATASWLVDGPLGAGLPAAGDPARATATPLRPVEDEPGVDDDPVVIVASALRVPGGVETPEAFWQMLDTGAIGVGPFPDDRGWDLDRFLAMRAMLPGLDVVTDAGFVAGAAGFDPELFGITPEEALVMDPQQRLLLELAWETFERAGTDPRSVGGTRTGVYLGTFFQNYVGDLRRVPESSMPYVSTGTGSPFACARVAYALGLDGPTLTVDTGCSSSAIALHLASQAVRAGECTSALVGGITVMAFPAAFPDLGGVSPDGRCRSFSEDADGTGWGEGA
ncbi:MAG: SDR family NAD(P)-dependent oxidoreductase, partial [Pseudonocardia sp.]|nr:SDR family NAD(P)-dependent oxidoreductase [Pseudonocardia sp.]